MTSTARLSALPSLGPARRLGLSVVRPEPAARLGLEELQGRLCELRLQRDSLAYTRAIAWVREAQAAGEPAAWVTPPTHGFYPPDVQAHGVDLAALPVVRLAPPVARLRAVDMLLRSGAFGLIVLDWEQQPPPPERILVRLVGLAKHHRTALVGLTAHPQGLGGQVSLRLHPERAQEASGRYLCRLGVSKDKRGGPAERGPEVFSGPDGLY
ncbi:MAG: recombinase A [Candidatus Sericytochromatia bacterium]|nr:recombinase A [Candidatus Sericytochromatia bacterium]